LANKDADITYAYFAHITALQLSQNN